MRIPFALLVSIFAASCGAQSPKEPSEPTQYWRGAYDIGGLRWDIGLRFSGDCAAGAALDVAAVWRANVRADEFSCDAESIGFSLPMDLGRFEGKRAEGAIEGVIRRSDGASAGLTLSPAALPKVRIEDFSFDHNDLRIGATLVLPEGEGPFPAVVIVHGGGDSDRYAPPYHFWGDYLAERGFAVVRYDKRGNGESGGAWREVGFGPRADDLAAIVDRLAARKDIVSASVGALAVSQGGWVTTLASTKTENLAFYATVSSPMVTPGIADTFATVSAMRARGLADAEISKVVAIWEEEMALMRQLDSEVAWAKYDALVEQAKNEDWYVRADYSPLTRDAWFGRWYAQVMDFDPATIVRESRVPSLWLYGSADTQSDPARNMEIISDLKASSAPVEAMVFSGGDHGVMISRDPDEMYLAAAPGFFDALESWLDKAAGAKDR